MPFPDEEPDRKFEGAVLSARPTVGDARTGALILRHGITFGPAGLLFYVLFRVTGDWASTICSALLLAAFAGIAFGYDFFGWHLKGFGRWRRDAPDLARQEYFTWAGHPSILGIRSPNGRRLTLLAAFKVAVLPTTIHGNFKQFCKQLASARVPFSFQVVHAPALPQAGPPVQSIPAGSRPRDWREHAPEREPGWAPKLPRDGAWHTSILYSTRVTARGYLLSAAKVRALRRQLDAQAMSLAGAFASNYPHSKLAPLEGVALAQACQGLFPGEVLTSGKRLRPRLRPADVVKLPIAAAWAYLAAALFAIFELDLLGALGTLLVTSLAIFCTIPSLWPVAVSGDKVTYYDPWANQHFYLQRRRGRTARGVACIRNESRVASFAGLGAFGHLSLEGYSDPNKWLRQVMAAQIPVLYQWSAEPLSFGQFYGLAKRCFASDAVRAAARAEPAPAQETFLAHWGGWWHAAGLVGTRADIPLANLRDAKEWSEGRKVATKQLRALGQLTINAFRDSGLYRLRAQDVRAGLAVMAGHALSAWESGTAFCKFVVAGTTYGPYVQVMADLKKGVETCVPAEFNTPTRLDNFVVMGQALNTEFLQSETPAGFSEQCLAAPVVVFGGAPRERSLVIQKIAIELLAKGEGGIALDATGSWTALARVAGGTALWRKVTVQVAGQDFWADPFALARVTPLFTEALCDALSLIRDFTLDQREFLYQACYKVDENSLELNAVAHALEMILAERAKFIGDPVVGAVQTLAAGRTALFFRSGAVNLPVASWAKSNALVILDFSPLPEPQSSIARAVVFLYLAYLARSGATSTRVYYDNPELLLRTPRGNEGGPVNLEQFAQWFALGNLPVVAGVGRPALVPPSFLELFDATVCLQVRNKNDLRVIAAQMALDDRAEGGLYSEHRKSSYQVEFVAQMRPGWAVLKRSDAQEPFAITLSPSPLAKEGPVLPAEARKISAPLAPVPGTELASPSESRAGETLVEHDLGTLGGFAGEVLDFLEAAAAAQDLNGGPVSQKLLADQLLFKLQPALFKFHLSDQSGRDIRNRLLDALAAADYLRATYRKPPGGGPETGAATVYEVTPKYLEALDDAKAKGSAALQAKIGKITGAFAGQFAALPAEGVGLGDTSASPPVPQVTPGKLEQAFVHSFLVYLAAARVALLNGNFAEASKWAQTAWTRFLAQALNRAPGDIPDLDGEALVQTLAEFPEWPFDAIETRVLWDDFRPSAWESLPNDVIGQKINELTSFHEQYQLRNADRAY